MIRKIVTYVQFPEPVLWSFSLNSYWWSFDKISRVEDARMLAARDVFNTRMRELNEQLRVSIFYIAFVALRLIVGGQTKLNTQ